MGDFVLNDALGRFAEKIADGADIILVPLSAMDADGTVKNAGPDLATVLALGGTTEQTTGGWSRKVILNAAITLTVDDSSDLVKVILPDETWIGPTAGNDTVDLLVNEDGATDALRNVLTAHDFVVIADGNDVTADFHDTNGVWQAA